MQRMKQYARSAVYWPRIDQVIEWISWQCTACAQLKNQPVKPAINSWMLPEKLWSRLHLHNGVSFLWHDWLVLVDVYSKYPHIHMTCSRSDRATTELLEQDFALKRHLHFRSFRRAARPEVWFTSQEHLTIQQPVGSWAPGPDIQEIPKKVEVTCTTERSSSGISNAIPKDPITIWIFTQWSSYWMGSRFAQNWMQWCHLWLTSRKLFKLELGSMKHQQKERKVVLRFWL